MKWQSSLASMDIREAVDDHFIEPDDDIEDAIRYRMPDATREDIIRVGSAMERVQLLFPRVTRTTLNLLEGWYSGNFALVPARDPLLHFGYQQINLWLQEISEKIQNKKLLLFDIEDMFSSLYELHAICINKNGFVAQQFAGLVRQLSIYLCELSALLAKLSCVEACDILRIGDVLFEKMQQLQPGEAALDPSIRFIPKIADFTTERVLGAGAFGVVYKGRYLPANMVCTLKIVAAENFGTVEHIISDRVVAAVADHPLLVSYACVFATETATITVMEYLKAVDVQKVVDRARNLRVEQARIIFAQMVSAVMHMHYNGLMHRDIKGSNALIMLGGKVKLIDFDTSKICVGHFGTRHVYSYFRRTAVEINDGEKAGTLPYMSPEVICQKAYGRAMDWWSMGITLFKLMIGRVPFRAQDETVLKNQICNDDVDFPRFKATRAQPVTASMELIRGLLQKKTSERLGSSNYQEILDSAFLAPIDWNWLVYADQLLKLPAFGRIMYELNKGGKKTKLKFSNSQVMQWSPEASLNTKQRTLIKLQDLKDKREGQQPLFTYVSPAFRETFKTGVASKAMCPTAAMKTLRKYAPSKVLELNSTKMLNPLQAERLDVAVMKARSARLGVKLMPTSSDGGRLYYVITQIKPGDPTAQSGLLEGDVVTAINGIPIIDASKNQLEPLLAAQVDEVFVSVLSSNTIRAMATRIDYQQIISMTKPIDITYTNPAVQTDIVVRLGKYYDVRTKTYLKAPVLFYLPPDNNCGMYVGDVILTINGIQALQQPPEELQLRMGEPQATRTLTIAPVSGLRNERLFLDRLLRTYDGTFVSLLKDAPDMKPLVIDEDEDRKTETRANRLCGFN